MTNKQQAASTAKVIGATALLVQHDQLDQAHISCLARHMELWMPFHKLSLATALQPLSQAAYCTKAAVVVQQNQ